MLRRILVAGLLGAVGCQGGFNPLAPYGATRVPPPSTGTIGRTDSYLSPSGGVPGSQVEQTGRLPSRGTDDGAWRPSGADAALGSARPLPSSPPASLQVSETSRQRPADLPAGPASPHEGQAAAQGVQLSSGLTWLDPRQASSPAAPAGAPAAASHPQRSADVPRLLSVNPSLYPSTTDPLRAPPPVNPIPASAAPRIRGFSSTGYAVDPLQPASDTSMVDSGSWNPRR